jgi:predicted amidohydrolase YtcJ
MGGDVCGPEERVDLNTAICMHTINGAYAEFADDRKGSIEVGKYADLTLLSEDIRLVNVSELRDLQISMTLVEGRVCYEAS